MSLNYTVVFLLSNKVGVKGQRSPERSFDNSPKQQSVDEHSEETYMLWVWRGEVMCRVPVTCMLGAAQTHRQTSHLETCPPHVTCYTSLHWIESEVIFWTVASVVYCRFSVRHHWFVASLPIGVNGWWLATTRPPHKACFTFRCFFSPLQPTHFDTFSIPFMLSLFLLYGDLICPFFNRGPKTRHCGTQGEILGFHTLASALWLDDRTAAGSLKCWVIFQKMFSIRFEVRAQYLLTLGQTCAGATRIRVDSGDTGCCSILLNRWVSFWQLLASKFKQERFYMNILGEFFGLLRWQYSGTADFIRRHVAQEARFLFTVGLHIYMSPLDTEIIGCCIDMMWTCRKTCKQFCPHPTCSHECVKRKWVEQWAVTVIQRHKGRGDQATN